MRKVLTLLVLCFAFFGLCQVQASTAALQNAQETVKNEIKAALSGNSKYVEQLGAYSDFKKDLTTLLERYPETGAAKPLNFNNKTVKILVPMALDEKTVGGFFQLSPNGKEILSYLVWDKNLKPLFKVNREAWEKCEDASTLPELAELVPLKEGHSAGVPVELSDLTDVFIIDYVDMIPSKTQEETEEYTKTVGLKATLGRRTGSSKCLGYSASIASDWWNVAQGNNIGSYDSFVNGAREYGMNPRLVESLYFNHAKCPYSFVKETGKDRVTGEKIPYSPKHYAWIMSSIELPKVIRDPLKKDKSYKLSRSGFAMDLPFDNSFDRSRGDINKIRSDLQKFGIMYAQHTSRLFKDKVPLSVQGVHAVNIVGTAKLKGEPVALYYETFGKNRKGYMEDSFYGPALRAFPVKFFYQGIYFPHRIIPEIKIGGGKAIVSFKTAQGKNIIPEKLSVKINNKSFSAKVEETIEVPLSEGVNSLQLNFSRRYFYTPEEANGYQRNFIISKNNVIELKHYEAVLNSIKERKGGLFTKLFGKKSSYTDHLAKTEEMLRNTMQKTLQSARNDGQFLSLIAAEVSKSKALKASAFGKSVNEMMKFNKLNQ